MYVCTLGLHSMSGRAAVHVVVHVLEEEHQEKDHGISVLL